MECASESGFQREWVEVRPAVVEILVLGSLQESYNQVGHRCQHRFDSNLHEKIGQREAARAAYQAALRLQPNYEAATAALANLK